jgi:hypothetical protein
MSPFGNLYDMPVYADASLAEYEQITFSAGTHRKLMRMNWGRHGATGEPDDGRPDSHPVRGGRCLDNAPDRRRMKAQSRDSSLGTEIREIREIRMRH